MIMRSRLLLCSSCFTICMRFLRHHPMSPRATQKPSFIIHFSSRSVASATVISVARWVQANQKRSATFRSYWRWPINLRSGALPLTWPHFLLWWCLRTILHMVLWVIGAAKHNAQLATMKPVQAYDFIGASCSRGVESMPNTNRYPYFDIDSWLVEERCRSLLLLLPSLSFRSPILHWSGYCDFVDYPGLPHGGQELRQKAHLTYFDSKDRTLYLRIQIRSS